jgi:hypothetical protein
MWKLKIHVPKFTYAFISFFFAGFSSYFRFWKRRYLISDFSIKKNDEKIIKNNNIKDLIKTFADKLIIRAYDINWEELEITDLVLLISQELKFNSNSFLKFLNRIENASSITLLNQLSENGYTFSSFELINFFELRASDVRHFITLITDSLEYKLISLSDGENINLVSYTYIIFICL